ncbi:myb-like protein AA isoform X2 [Octopus sinensis]|uniref:Myb-like protein AA isoform X2 n=1 Tax=Octopus sinensis TaxID=2607531 RepID=A0A7E6F5P9_9MOLL|nr:myb-like protein AA isoform X2 [Octopus sinensis]
MALKERRGGGFWGCDTFGLRHLRPLLLNVASENQTINAVGTNLSNAAHNMNFDDQKPTSIAYREDASSDSASISHIVCSRVTTVSGNSIGEAEEEEATTLTSCNNGSGSRSSGRTTGSNSGINNGKVVKCSKSCDSGVCTSSLSNPAHEKIVLALPSLSPISLRPTLESATQQQQEEEETVNKRRSSSVVGLWRRGGDRADLRNVITNAGSQRRPSKKTTRDPVRELRKTARSRRRLEEDINSSKVIIHRAPSSSSSSGSSSNSSSSWAGSRRNISSSGSSVRAKILLGGSGRRLGVSPSSDPGCRNSNDLRYHYYCHPNTSHLTVNRCGSCCGSTNSSSSHCGNTVTKHNISSYLSDDLSSSSSSSSSGSSSCSNSSSYGITSNSSSGSSSSSNNNSSSNSNNSSSSSSNSPQVIYHHHHHPPPPPPPLSHSCHRILPRPLQQYQQQQQQQQQHQQPERQDTTFATHQKLPTTHHGRHHHHQQRCYYYSNSNSSSVVGSPQFTVKVVPLPKEELSPRLQQQQNTTEPPQLQLLHPDNHSHKYHHHHQHHQHHHQQQQQQHNHHHHHHRRQHTFPSRFHLPSPPQPLPLRSFVSSSPVYVQQLIPAARGEPGSAREGCFNCSRRSKGNNDSPPQPQPPQSSSIIQQRHHSPAIAADQRRISAPPDPQNGDRGGVGDVNDQHLSLFRQRYNQQQQIRHFTFPQYQSQEHYNCKHHQQLQQLQLQQQQQRPYNLCHSREEGIEEDRFEEGIAYERDGRRTYHFVNAGAVSYCRRNNTASSCGTATIINTLPASTTATKSEILQPLSQFILYVQRSTLPVRLEPEPSPSAQTSPRPAISVTTLLKVFLCTFCRHHRHHLLPTVAPPSPLVAPPSQTLPPPQQTPSTMSVLTTTTTI